MRFTGSIVLTLLVALGVAAGATATPKKVVVEIAQKVDVPLASTTFYPKRVHAINVSQGLLKLDLVTWRVYPVLVQSTNRSTKHAFLEIDIQGPLEGGFTNAPITLNADGQTLSVNTEWKDQETIFGGDAVSTRLEMDASGAFRQIAQAKDLYLTVLVPGTDTRYTAHLRADDLANFKALLDKFESLDPR